MRPSQRPVPGDGPEAAGSDRREDLPEDLGQDLRQDVREDLPPELPTLPPDGLGLPADALKQTSSAQLDRLAPGRLPLPRWFAVLFGLCAIGLIPWIVYLAMNLPHQRRDAHYALAWVGFDLAMLASLAMLAIFTVKRSTWTEPTAVFTGTLLLVDAWFDVVTADNDRDFLLALLSALIVEIPLAIICLWMAHSTEVMRRRAYRSLWQRAGTLQNRVGALQHRLDRR